MSMYVRPDATFPAIAEFGGRATMSPNEVGQGWSTTSQTRPPADKFNTRDFMNSAAVKYLCRLGLAEWSPDEEYQGRGLCIGSNGSVYWNLLPCKGINPVTDTMGYWELTPVRAHDALNLFAGQLGGFLTRAVADTLYVDWNTFNQTAGNLSGRLDGAEGNINWINGRTGALEGWRNDVQNWINGRNGNFDELFWWRDYHSGQINDLYGRANTADANIGTVNGRVDAVNQRVDGLTPTGDLSGNGWTRLPNGLILKWQQGGATSANGSTQTTWFSPPFPQACIFASINMRHAGGGNQGAYPSATITGWNNQSVTWWWNRNADQGGFTIVPLIFSLGY
jgi:hypothetical protein